MTDTLIGWDIGGAHVKAAHLDGTGKVLALTQEACALWRGIQELEQAIPNILARLAAPCPVRHAVTMTGELVDAFADRRNGVQAIIAALGRLLGHADLWVFAGPHGLLPLDRLAPAHYGAVASANWLVSASFIATQCPAALFIDLGSTTADILPVSGGKVHYRGYSDFERLRQEELVYTGVVRTPVMAVAERVPFDGDMILLAAEHFATMADVYRLTGQLPEHADQWPSADNGEKSTAGSARRLARMLGCDFTGADLAAWRQVAVYLRESQLAKLHWACLRQLSRGSLDESAPLVGAGVGRFVLPALAARLARPYVDIGAWLTGLPDDQQAFGAADLAPAVAVAKLALDLM
ncbi:MAG: hypothetical protein EPN21_13900 [Methylococcaceae bacterium]|nr:MAG: hypothetical protein EPN21_13900 [Methylococcaceae bacterium]